VGGFALFAAALLAFLLLAGAALSQHAAPAGRPDFSGPAAPADMWSDGYGTATWQARDLRSGG